MYGSLPFFSAGFRFARQATIAEPIDHRVVVLLVLAMGYNALLAVFNAYVATISFSTVAITEILLLTICVGLILKQGIKADSVNILLFGCASLGLALVISLLNERFFVEAFRNALIIVIFGCMGRQINFATLNRTFIVCSLLVLGFLIIELASLSAYASIFKPAQYFFSTRGTVEFELDDSGIFRNALGFEGRFSFGLFSGARTSSLFLEQVSLSNYAGVLCLLLLALWPYLSRWTRALHGCTAVLIILSNNARTTSILFVLAVIGYYLYPRLPKFSNVLIAPVVMLTTLVVYRLYPNAAEDDFIGRVSHTGKILHDMGYREFWGLSIDQMGGLMDSGYPYIIYSSTVVGLLLHWLFVSFIVPQHSVAQRRCAFGLAFFTFTNLVIGGTAIFSIKIAALLWLLVGFMSSPQRNAIERHASSPTTVALP